MPCPGDRAHAPLKPLDTAHARLSARDSAPQNWISSGVSKWDTAQNFISADFWSWHNYIGAKFCVLSTDFSFTVYTGSHSKTIVFGLITLDGEGFFQRYDSFTGKEFVEFLKAACERFGKILMITDGAPQHRSKFVREEIGRLDGVELQFLPPGCPDLNAIEEVWRQMKHAILDVPYVRFSSMCSDIDKWLRSSLPKLDIERYLYRKA